ncbi:MAG: hypothetical protein KKA42_10800 [candidate division Zixibacteria bacterium]|nr:hypothetical protein [candidate division Zixibacteria bacterium]
MSRVKADPFMTIGEIRDELAARADDFRVSWWRVFAVMRRHRLLKKRSRFRFAWGRSEDGF